jgi:hypothetical protein
MTPSSIPNVGTHVGAPIGARFDSRTSDRDRTKVGSRLLFYAAAASVAGGGAADAAVVDSGTWAGWTGTAGGTVGNGPFTDSTSAFGGDTLVDDAFSATVRQATGFGLFRYGRLTASANGEFAVGRRAAGAVIGTSLGFQSWSNSGGIAAVSQAQTSNPWQPVAGPGWAMSTGTGADSVHGYLAFRIFDGSSAYYFGYFEVTMSRTGTGYDSVVSGVPDVGTPSTISMTIHGWAYESVAGQSITIPGAAAVPGGAGLAALVAGAAGLRGRRRAK